MSKNGMIEDHCLSIYLQLESEKAVELPSAGDARALIPLPTTRRWTICAWKESE
jgi:hypothetical protein